MEKNAGKIRDICQSKNVGTVLAVWGRNFEGRGGDATSKDLVEKEIVSTRNFCNE